MRFTPDLWDGFIETGSGGGIGFGLADDITNAVIEEERMTSLRKYHTITESKNGAGAVPIETEKGWLHLAHGVRNTAAGLRYVLYVFVTDLHEPWKVIAEPSGYFLAPLGEERVGDVSNVVFHQRCDRPPGWYGLYLLRIFRHPAARCHN